MIRDYRLYLKRKSAPVVRTVKAPGTVEIVGHPRFGYHLHRYGEHPLPKEGRRFRAWRMRRMLEE